MTKKLFLALLAVGLFIPSFKAQDAAEKKEDKFIRLTTMEEAFAKALRNRKSLAQYILSEREELKKAEEKDKEAIKKKLDAATVRYAQLNAYMEIIYGLGNRREYEYNNVTSEIYLRVGTITEVFKRAIDTRNAYAKSLVALQKQLDAETDEAKKKTLQATYDKTFKEYALVANALYNIFQIHPKRDYHYDAASRTLYLKSNDEEISKLNEELEKARKEKEQAAEQPAKPKAE